MEKTAIRSITIGVYTIEMTDAAAESDQSLLAAYQRGDLAGFERIYARYAPAMLSCAIGMLGDRAAAEDALQQVFAKFIKLSPGLPANTNVRAYLFAAVRNCSVNIRRTRARTAAASAGYEALVRPRVNHSPDADAAALADELRRELNDALARLGDDERETVLLRTQGGLTFSELAFALGVPRGTAVTRYRSAITKLREMLDHEQK
ncbi:MAG TPA: sigma-70 family RNA polymerase sigma factor [Planctomycetota bacterium]|nr:sigma-70 family RNA polymerase sigma factor [Planctomycetota bacterium]